MPIRDQAAQERSLDNDYGTTRGPNAPDAHEVALFDTDMVELAGNGYARPTLSNDDWLPATDGLKLSGPVTFPAPTGPWDTAAYIGLYDPDAGLWWDVVELEEELDVTAAGPGPVVPGIPIFYNDND